jgi:hypothetical protein
MTETAPATVTVIVQVGDAGAIAVPRDTDSGYLLCPFRTCAEVFLEDGNLQQHVSACLQGPRGLKDAYCVDVRLGPMLT